VDLWAVVRVARILHKRPSEVLAWSAWEIALIIGDAVQEHEAIEKRTGTGSSVQPSAPGSAGARTTTTQSFRFVVKKKE
jgi:hypothetical protein